MPTPDCCCDYQFEFAQSGVMGVETLDFDCSSNHCDLIAQEYSITIPDGVISQGGATCDCSEYEGTWVLDYRSEHSVPATQCIWRYDDSFVDCSEIIDTFVYSLRFTRLTVGAPGRTLVEVWCSGFNGWLVAEWEKIFTSSDELDCLGSFELDLIYDGFELTDCIHWPSTLTVTAV
jgi:hypothetical protein